LSQVLAELVKTKDQVRYLLEKYPHTRNHDFYLQLMWLKVFGCVQIPYLDWSMIKAFSGRLETVRRVRQKIQNEDREFLPTDPEILRRRRVREAEYRSVIGKV